MYSYKSMDIYRHISIELYGYVSIEWQPGVYSFVSRGWSVKPLTQMQFNAMVIKLLGGGDTDRLVI
jgi:hypothetical protein